MIQAGAADSAQSEDSAVRRLPEEVRPVLAAYRALLTERFGPRLLSLRLFGSRARGDAAPDSDADVVVVVRGLDDAGRALAIDLAFEAWCSIGRQGPVPSPLVWSEAEEADRLALERRIALDVQREGIAA
jgi:predicted nucleotidyltransferase